MKFTLIPENTFKELQLNAGILLKTFEPSSGTVSAANIVGATSGGVTFNAMPSFKDNGEGIDNCPKNMKELKEIDKWEITLGGTFVTVNAENVKNLVAAADVSGDKITPRADLKDTDFSDLWWVGDYSDKNGAKNGGYVAVHMMNTLSTGGFSLQTNEKEKGQFAFTYTAHYSMAEQEKVPFEVYVHSGTEEGMGA